MSKKSFRRAKAPEEPSASYPTWEEAGTRRSFLAALGKAAAGGVLASLAVSCGDNRTVDDPDAGPKNFSDGVGPQPDIPQRPIPDMGAAPQTDVWPQFVDGLPRQPDVGPPPGPDISGGLPDQAPAPPDMWPTFSDGLPSQPDVYYPPANDAGGAPMPPAPRDRKK